MLTYPFQTDPAESLMTATMKEFEKLLGKGVLGTPVSIGEHTLAPVMITTFGVGTGGSSIYGETSGGGGGGGVIPLAIIIVGPNGVQIQELDREATCAASSHVASLARELGVKGRGGKTVATGGSPVLVTEPATTASTTTTTTTF